MFNSASQHKHIVLRPLRGSFNLLLHKCCRPAWAHQVLRDVIVLQMACIWCGPVCGLLSAAVLTCNL